MRLSLNPFAFYISPLVVTVFLYYGEIVRVLEAPPYVSRLEVLVEAGMQFGVAALATFLALWLTVVAKKFFIHRRRWPNTALGGAVIASTLFFVLYLLPISTIMAIKPVLVDGLTVLGYGFFYLSYTAFAGSLVQPPPSAINSTGRHPSPVTSAGVARFQDRSENWG